MANNPHSDSTVRIQLSRLDTLPDIAAREVNHVSETGKELDQERGISRHIDLTTLRHLTLWAGTLRALIALKEQHGERVQVHFNKGPPAHRGNLVSHPDGVTKAFCVGIEEWDIGLDSDFYEITAPEIRHEFYKNLRRPATSEKTLNDLESTLSEARRTQHHLMDKEIRSKSLRRVLASIVEESSVSYPWDQGDGGSKGIIEALETTQGEEVLTSIQAYQRRIDEDLLVKARRRLGA